MKKYLYTITALAILALIILFAWQTNSSKKYKSLYYKELQNVEAYKTANSGLEGEIKEYKMTLADLYSSKDTLDIKLSKALQDLEVADNKVRNLQYQLKHATRTDTLFLYDTIFMPDVCIDTTLGDFWYNVRLQMEYPSTVIASPTFNSEQIVYIYNKKEYVGGKSKCFFINWFKKKYIVTEVKVEEKNPYINVINQKFIELQNE